MIFKKIEKKVLYVFKKKLFFIILTLLNSMFYTKPISKNFILPAGLIFVAEGLRSLPKGYISKKNKKRLKYMPFISAGILLASLGYDYYKKKKENLSLKDDFSLPDVDSSVKSIRITEDVTKIIEALKKTIMKKNDSLEFQEKQKKLEEIFLASNAENMKGIYYKYTKMYEDIYKSEIPVHFYVLFDRFLYKIEQDTFLNNINKIDNSPISPMFDNLKIKKLVEHFWKNYIEKLKKLFKNLDNIDEENVDVSISNIKDVICFLRSFEPSLEKYKNIHNNKKKIVEDLVATYDLDPVKVVTDKDLEGDFSLVFKKIEEKYILNDPIKKVDFDNRKKQYDESEKYLVENKNIKEINDLIELYDSQIEIINNANQESLNDFIEEKEKEFDLLLSSKNSLLIKNFINNLGNDKKDKNEYLNIEQKKDFLEKKHLMKKKMLNSFINFLSNEEPSKKLYEEVLNVASTDNMFDEPDKIKLEEIRKKNIKFIAEEAVKKIKSEVSLSFKNQQEKDVFFRGTAINSTSGMIQFIEKMEKDIFKYKKISEVIFSGDQALRLKEGEEIEKRFQSIEHFSIQSLNGIFNIVPASDILTKEEFKKIVENFINPNNDSNNLKIVKLNIIYYIPVKDLLSLKDKVDFIMDIIKGKGLFDYSLMELFLGKIHDYCLNNNFYLYSKKLESTKKIFLILSSILEKLKNNSAPVTDLNILNEKRFLLKMVEIYDIDIDASENIQSFKLFLDRCCLLIRNKSDDLFIYDKIVKKIRGLKNYEKVNVFFEKMFEMFTHVGDFNIDFNFIDKLINDLIEFHRKMKVDIIDDPLKEGVKQAPDINKFLDNLFKYKEIKYFLPVLLSRFLTYNFEETYSMEMFKKDIGNEKTAEVKKEVKEEKKKKEMEFKLSAIQLIIKEIGKEIKNITTEFEARPGAILPEMERMVHLRKDLIKKSYESLKSSDLKNQFGNEENYKKIVSSYFDIFKDNVVYTEFKNNINSGDFFKDLSNDKFNFLKIILPDLISNNNSNIMSFIFKMTLDQGSEDIIKYMWTGIITSNVTQVEKIRQIDLLKAILVQENKLNQYLFFNQDINIAIVENGINAISDINNEQEIKNNYLKIIQSPLESQNKQLLFDSLKNKIGQEKYAEYIKKYKAIEKL